MRFARLVHFLFTPDRQLDLTEHTHVQLDFDEVPYTQPKTFELDVFKEQNNLVQNTDELSLFGASNQRKRRDSSKRIKANGDSNPSTHPKVDRENIDPSTDSEQIDELHDPQVPSYLAQLDRVREREQERGTSAKKSRRRKRRTPKAKGTQPDQQVHPQRSSGGNAPKSKSQAKPSSQSKSKTSPSSSPQKSAKSKSQSESKESSNRRGRGRRRRKPKTESNPTS